MPWLLFTIRFIIIGGQQTRHLCVENRDNLQVEVMLFHLLLKSKNSVEEAVVEIQAVE